MRIRAIAITAMLLAIVGGSASAMDSFDNLKVGKMALSFNPQSGFKLDYGGATVFTESSLRAMKPGWIAIYYSYKMGKKDVRITDIPGGKAIVIPHQTPSFDGMHRVTMTENKITFDLTYKLTADVDDAGIEYNIGYLSAPLITGCSYETNAREGAESGIIPLKAITDGWDGSITKNSFDKIVLHSRIGKITVQTNGEPNDLQLVDSRGLRVTWAEKHPIFMLSAPRKLLKQNEERHSVVTITFDPLPEAAKPTVGSRSASTTIHDTADLHKTTPKQVAVIPEPQEMRLTDGDFVLNDKTRIVVVDSAKEEDLRGVKSFAEEILSLYKIRIQIVRAGKLPLENVILVGEAATGSKQAKVAQTDGVTAPAKDEGYALKVTPKRILVLGHDRRGTFYGMQTLKQLVKVSYESIAVQGCEIDDYPSLKFRGAHLYTGNRALPFHEKLIDRIFSRFKMNNLVLCVDQIQWKSEPKLAPSYAMSQADVKKEIKFANAHFMECTPEISSLGHTNWMFYNHQHLDLAEDPAHPYAYCPSNEDSYKFIFKIFDEAIDLFHPKYVHIGHDEVTSVEAEFPHDPVCKQKSIPDLFLRDTLRLYDHLKSKNVGIMMWGDMMLSPGISSDACNMADAKEAARLRNSIPKDVIVTDWHYDIAKPQDFGGLKAFQDAGHKTIAATWYTPANIRNFSQAAKDNHSLGLLQTTWAGTDSNETNLRDSREQFTAFVLAAEYAWNSGRTSLEELPYQTDDAFFSEWNRTPAKRECLKGFTVDLSAFYNVPLANATAAPIWIGTSTDSDLSPIPTGCVRLLDDSFYLGKDARENSALRLASALDESVSYPESAEIPIGRTAASLLFLHTCAWQEVPNKVVGSYRINYADNSSTEIPLIYRKNTAAWVDSETCSDALVAWRHESKDGERTSIRETVWTNPNPEKPIKSIIFCSAGTSAGPTLLGISGISPK
jgi:hypothetical protein